MLSDDRLLFLGNLRNSGSQARLFEQLDRQVMTMRSRTAIGNDQGLIDKRVDEQAAPAGKLVPRRR